jgi:cation transport ATPase
MGKDSFLSQVIALVTEAQQSKSKTQNLAHSFNTDCYRSLTIN